MRHTISANQYTASISSLGAELKSFKNEATGCEYIWQGDPDIWQGSAPILFPVVGRLKDGGYLYNNKKYELAKHGFARTSTFTLCHDSSDKKTFMLASSPETETSYPFYFQLFVEFKIDTGCIAVSYTVKNSGHSPMFFTIGSHPAFFLPMSDCQLEDYYIEFEKKETLDCYFLENGLLTVTPIPGFLKNENRIRITKTLFENDALIFKNIASKKISIKNKNTGYSLTMDTGGAPHLGIWAKPGAPYACLEPWFSHDNSHKSSDDLRFKEGMMELDPGKKFKTGYSIII